SSPQTPPLVPTSRKLIFRSRSVRLRRTSSLKEELPPSMSVSPGSRRRARSVTTCSVGGPAGTITHATRGALSLATKSSSVSAPTAPSPASWRTAFASAAYATTSWPPRRSRRAMFPPIRPRPTIPICMMSVLRVRRLASAGGSHDQNHRLASRRASPSLRGRRSARTTRITDSPPGAPRRASAAAARLARPESQTRLPSPDRSIDGRPQRPEPVRDVRAEMDPQGAAAALDENEKVAARLGGLHGAERVRPPGHREILRVVARDLEEHARVRAPLVRLPGRVQEARPEAHARRDPVSVPDRPPDRLVRGLVRRGTLDGGGTRDVVSGQIGRAHV